MKFGLCEGFKRLKTARVAGCDRLARACERVAGLGGAWAPLPAQDAAQA